MFPKSVFAHPVSSFNVPASIIDEEPGAGNLIPICINSHWIPYILGALEQLLLQTTWDTDDASVLALQQARVMDLIGLFDVANECCGLRIRDGVPEFTQDGGVTWTPVPQTNDGTSGHDPRLEEPLKPHRTGDNIPCLAAANAVACFVELHREIVKWWDDTLPILVFCAAISAILQVFFQIGWATFAIAVNYSTIVNQLLNYSGALTNASFTTTIQDELMCILFCKANADGQWNLGTFGGVLFEVQQKTGDMWRLIEIYLEQIGGYAGLNNAGVTTSVATADCEDCPDCTWCKDIDFTISNQGWYSIDVGYGGDSGPSNYTPDQGWTDTIHGLPQPSCFAAAQFDFGAGFYVTTVTVKWRNVTRTASGSVVVLGATGDRPADGDSDVVYNINATVSGWAYILAIIQSTGHVTLAGAIIRGTGDSPFGENNC